MKALLLALLLAAPPVAADAADEGGAIAARRERLSAELDELARRIERRKAEGARNGELEELLQRSQALARELAALERAAGVAPTRAPLSIELGPWEADDPDEARELADLLRDQRDRILEELETVGAHLDEARADEALARELRDFVEEADLFDDSSRVMRLRRTERRDASPAEPTEGAPAGPPTTPARNEDESAPPPDGVGIGKASDDFFGGMLDGGSQPIPTAPDLPSRPEPPAGGQAPSAPDPAPSFFERAGSRPLGSGEPGVLGFAPLDGDESVAELTRRRDALQRLAAELERRARVLEATSRDLAAPAAR